MPAYLSPVGNEVQTDANGNPLVGGQIFTYQAGTTTPIATYTGSDAGTAQANPIVLNSAGLPDSPIWLPAGQAVKLVFKDADGVTLRTVDNATGINDPSTTNTVDQWVTFAGAPTYISATSFSLAGDQTNTFQVGRRVKSTNTGGAVYSTISASSYNAGTGLTTVTVANDAGTMDSGLSSIFYGLISALDTSAPRQVIGVRRITVSGTYTPTAGTRAVLVELVGGGGAGGGCAATGAGQYNVGAGGGSGGYARSFLTSGFSGAAVTVGAGGAGVSGAAGASGGTSSFGALLSATGGGGGGTGGPIPLASYSALQTLAGPAGGSGSNGNVINADGAVGGHGFYFINPQGGVGGASFFGGGAQGRTAATTGFAAVSSGAGGGGCALGPSQSAVTGGAGAAGVVIVYEFG